MVIDMGGRHSFIDAAIMTEAFAPVQYEPPKVLTQCGQAIWNTATTMYQDVLSAVSNIIETRQFLKNTGHARDDFGVYYIADFNGVLDAGVQMQHYIMSQPQMQKAYDRGFDLYPDYVMPAESHVHYARAVDGIVQFADDGIESFTTTIDFGYDDLYTPTRMDMHNLNDTFSYMRNNIHNALGSLLLDYFEEE